MTEPDDIRRIAWTDLTSRGNPVGEHVAITEDQRLEAIRSHLSRLSEEAQRQIAGEALRMAMQAERREHPIVGGEF